MIMNLLEKDLEDIIYESLKDSDQSVELAVRGFPLINQRPVSGDRVKPFLIKRQLNISDYGIADIVTVDRIPGDKSVITIYELKKGAIGYNALFQALRYVAGIRANLFDRGTEDCYEIRIVLIGSKLIEDDWLYMFQFKFNIIVMLYTFNYTLTGLCFEDEMPELYGC